MTARLKIGLDLGSTTVKRFETEERARLGLPLGHTPQWHDPVPSTFTESQRPHTTLLLARLTTAQDLFLQAACATTRSDGSVRGCR